MGRIGVHDFFILISVWILHASPSFVEKPLTVIKFEMGKELKVLKTKMDMMDIAIMLTCSAVQVYFSRFADILGPRRTLTTCLALTGINLLSFRIWNSYPIFLMFFVFNGALQALVWPACLKCLATLCPNKYQNLICALVSTSTLGGSVVASVISVSLYCSHGWRLVYHKLSVLFFCLSFLAWISLKIPKRVNKVRSERTRDIYKHTLSELWSIPMVHELAVALLCVKFVTYSIYIWFPIYLMVEIGFPSSSFGIFLLMFDIGGVVGSVLSGYISDKWNPFVISLYGLEFSIISFIIFLITVPSSIEHNILFMFVIGACLYGPHALLGGSIPVSIGEDDGRKAGASVVGFINGFGIFGGVLGNVFMVILMRCVCWKFILFLSLIALSIGEYCLNRDLEFNKT